MARDLLHNSAKQALINDGWKITHDPYGLPYRPSWSIDLGAEKTFIAEKGLEKLLLKSKVSKLNPLQMNFMAFWGNI